MHQKIIVFVTLTICNCNGGLLSLGPQQQQQQHNLNNILPPFPTYGPPVKSNPSFQYLSPNKPQINQPQIAQQQSLQQHSFLQQLQPQSPQPQIIFQSSQSGDPLALQSQQASSYAPQPSGISSMHIGPASLTPLPPLQPQSVSNQLAAFKTTNPDLNELPQLQHSQQLILSKNTNTIDPEIFIPIANATLQAANLLATTLLETNSRQSNGFQKISPDTLKNSNVLNKTDLVVIKAQKTAYLIPGSESSNTIGHISYGQDITTDKLRELYNQRNQLPIAYTINQFLFIIKPENINFLNKLA